MLDATYRKYIKSPKWRAIRDLYWRTYGKKCQACGVRLHLHVHHMDYTRFGGQEVLSDLMGLCYTCHREVHQLHRRGGRKDLREVTMRFVQMRKARR